MRKQLHKDLDKLIDKVHFGNRLVLIMGSAQNVTNVVNYLSAYNIEVDGILDNDEKREGHFVKGLRIYRPEAVLAKYNDNALILIYSPQYWKQMQSQLEQWGYVLNKHIFIIPYHNKKENRLASIQKSCREAINGRKIYRKILDKYGENVFVFIVRGATGDVYINGLYIEEYCRKNNIDNYVMVGDAKGIVQVFSLFGIRNVERLTMRETNCLCQFHILTCGEVRQIKNLFMWHGRLYFNPCRIRWDDRFSFMDTYRYFLYGFETDDALAVPMFHTYEIGEKVEGYFRERNLKKGKTVVLSPYAYSVKQLPICFWNHLISELKEKGYDVCVNINTANELNPFTEAAPLFVPFKESVALLEYAGFFIGLRSGFCDIISSAKCKKVILYPEKTADYNYSEHRSDMMFSGLKNMGLAEGDVIELESALILDARNYERLEDRFGIYMEAYSCLMNDILSEF